MLKRTKIILAVVLPIVLVVGGSGFYLAKLPSNLEIREGTAKLVLHHIENGRTLCNNTTTYAVTRVNGNSELELGVSSYRIDRGGGEEEVFLNLYILGNFSGDINISTLKISAKGDAHTDNVGFFMGANKEKGLKMWPVDRIVPGSSGNSTCFVGYDVYSHNFQASTQILWEILGAKNDTTYGLIITAIAYVSSEKIPVTLNVVVEGVRK